jgi:hypothetical protein
VKVPGRMVEEVPVIGIASVFTPISGRNKGYAGSMMRLLSKKICAMTGGRGFSILFSDIGPYYYAVNGGWRTSGEAYQLIIPNTKRFTDTVAPELLQLRQAEECLNADVRAFEKEFAADSNITTVQMIPQYSELQWAILRDTQTAKHLNLEIVDVVGAKSTAFADDWGYILWFHEYKELCLMVLRLREPSSNAELRWLLKAAVSEAERSGLKKVRIWSPSPRLEVLCGIKKTIRNGELPCLLYCSGEENVHWDLIEKISWC